jgi:hypothetical protein
MKFLVVLFSLIFLCACGDAPQPTSPFAEIPNKTSEKAPPRPAKKFNSAEEAVNELIEACKAGDLAGIKQCLTESSVLMIERNELQASELAFPAANYELAPAVIREGFPFAVFTAKIDAGSKRFYCRKDSGSWLVDWEQEISVIEDKNDRHKIYDISNKMKPIVLQEAERPKGWLPEHRAAAKTAPPGQPPSANYRHGEKPLPSQKDEAEQVFKNAAGERVKIQYYDCKSVGEAQFRFWRLQQQLQALPGYAELSLADEAFYLAKADGSKHLPTCALRANTLVLQMFNVSREEALQCAGHVLKHTLSDNPHE